MTYEIVEQNIGRAGNFQQAQQKQQKWNNKYGEGNWITGYSINGKFFTREDAIKEIYDPSYFSFLDENPIIVKQLQNASGVFNPHALFSKSVDIQAETIERYMKSRGLSFQGISPLPIGSYQPKKNLETIFLLAEEKGLKVVNNKIQYPQIAYTLSPFKVPCCINPSISIEQFWQSEAKCLAVKKSLDTLVGDVFELAPSGSVICITTNGIVKKDGVAVMGRGIAQAARDKFSGVDVLLGNYLQKYGNRAFNLGSNYKYKGKTFTLASFPTKHNWREPSDLKLINSSCQQIQQMANKFNWDKVYLPIPGGTNGGLTWSQVKPIVSQLDQRFIIVSLNPSDFNEQRI